MILDSFDRAMRYASCHPGLMLGFEFLKSASIDTLEDGKHAIDGQQVFAIVAHDIGRSRDGAFLEFHRKYIDIQYVVSGREAIGWQPIGSCRQEKQAYNSDTDLGFFSDRPTSWFDVAPRSFAIFFPEDAHAPLASTGSVHKVVIKVAVA